MPARIVKDYSTPPGTPVVRVVYTPDIPRAERPRPVGSYGYDRATGRHYVLPPRPDPKFYVGLDLGQSSDWTALAAVQPVATGYDVVDLRRVRERPYTAIVRDVADYLDEPPLAGAGALVIDATGVGRPVLDMFHAAGLDPIALTITGGSKSSGHRRRPRVPKVELISGLLLAFQAGGLRIAASLPHASTLTRELAEMRRKVSANGHASYGVWRDGEHDDLVLALAIALWCADRRRGRVPAAPVSEPDPMPADAAPFDPLHRPPLDEGVRW